MDTLILCLFKDMSDGCYVFQNVDVCFDFFCEG